MTNVEILEELRTRWAQLQSKLAAVDGSEIGKKYPAVRAGNRTEALEAWRREFLAHLSSLEKEVLPKLREERRESITEAQQMLQQGKLGIPKRKNALLDLSRDEDNSHFLFDTQKLTEAAAETFGELMEAVDVLTRTMQLNTALALRREQTTEELAAAVAGFRATAAGDLGSFPLHAWASDRIALTTILRARAASGEARAEFATRSLSEIEEMLVAAQVQGSNALLSAVDKNVKEVRQAAEVILTNGTENLRPLTELMALLGRTLDRSAGLNPLEELKRAAAEQEEQEAERAREELLRKRE